jgi:hypothetical protein
MDLTEAASLGEGKSNLRPILNEADKQVNTNCTGAVILTVVDSQKGLKLREKIFVTLHAHIAGETANSFSVQKQQQFTAAVVSTNTQ